MDNKIIEKLTNKLSSLPRTFYQKNELIKFFECTLSLIIPFTANESVKYTFTDFIKMGESLLSIDSFSKFQEALPSIQDTLISDAESILKGDPAAKSLEEVFLCYPGFFASASHRIANQLYLLNQTLMARIIAEYAHSITGIDIHPGAKIGNNFCIDHGTGIVIGETCEIGDNVKIYQGVTLGALSIKKDLASTKRHPTLENNVVVYANATILGPITIGSGTIIGANVWLDKSVTKNSKILKDEFKHPEDYVI